MRGGCLATARRLDRSKPAIGGADVDFRTPSRFGASGPRPRAEMATAVPDSDFYFHPYVYNIRLFCNVFRHPLSRCLLLFYIAVVPRDMNFFLNAHATLLGFSAFRTFSPRTFLHGAHKTLIL
jgi:hypothetical protein